MVYQFPPNKLPKIKEPDKTTKMKGRFMGSGSVKCLG
jgi:hypothetical protein